MAVPTAHTGLMTSIPYRKAAFLAGLLISLFWASAAFSVQMPKLHFEIGDAPYRVWGDKVTVDREKNLVVIEGNVHIRQEDRLLTADIVRIYNETRKAEAEGNVRMDSPQGTATGDYAFIDFTGQTGRLKHGEIHIREGNYRFKGDLIEKTGPDSYFSLNSTFTTCNGDNPDWSFHGDEIEVTIDDFATIRGAKFEIRGMPIFYSPWFSFSTKVTRQSGLLQPYMGISSRSGFEFELPYFWAISDNSDATFYPRILSRRGWKQGVEYRYILDPGSKGSINVDYLHDAKKDDDLYSDGYDRQEENRWWIRSRVDHALPNGIEAKVDIDLASDQDFLREFKSGFSGFSAVDHYYDAAFHRNLQDETSLFRESVVSATKRWDHFNANGGLVYFQGLTHQAFDETVAEKLPTFSFSAPLNPLFGSPLFYSFNSNYSYFWREEGSKGHRMLIDPGISMPLALGRYATITPFGRAREYVYDTDGDDSTADDGFGSRLESNLGVELSSHVSRVYSVSWGGLDAFKHVIKPVATYEYSTIDQSGGLPMYDPCDTQQSVHRVRYGLENDFIGRFVNAQGLTSYRDLARLRILQEYDIKEANRDFYGPDDENKPFSNLRGELECYPFPQVALIMDTTFNIYDGQFNSYNAYVHAADMRGDLLQLDYRFTRDSVEELNAWLTVRATQRVDLLGFTKTSLSADKAVESGVGFGLRFQCWGLRFMFRNSPDEQNVGLTFSLLGVGEVQALSFGF